MSSSHIVKACRLCLAMDIKLMEIEMGLKNSVKSMLGENIYYTSGLPSHICFECAAQLRKYTKFRRKCRRVQTFLYGILKKNGEVTKEELHKINRSKLGLESSLSASTVVSESFGEPNEVVKEENTYDLDVSVVEDMKVEDDVTIEDDIDIKTEEPYDDQEHEDMTLETDAENIQTNACLEFGDQDAEFLEYMATLGTGPYLKERSSKNQDVIESSRNSRKSHIDSVTIERENRTLPNTKLPTSTTKQTAVSSSQFIVCKKCLGIFTTAIFSEHERHCKQDVNQETVSVLKNLGVSVLPEQNVETIKPATMTQYNDKLQKQFSSNVKNIEHLAAFAEHDLNKQIKMNKPLLLKTDIDRQLQDSNVPFKDKTFGKQYVNKKKGTSSTKGIRMKNNNLNNELKKKNKNVEDVSISASVKNPTNFICNTNITKIDVNKYMKAIDLLPQVPDNNNQMHRFKRKCVRKVVDMISTTVTNHEKSEYINDVNQKKSEVIRDFTLSSNGSVHSLEIIEDDDLPQLTKNSDDIRKFDKTNNLIVNTNNANKGARAKNHDTDGKFNKTIDREFINASKVEHETILVDEDIKDGEFKTEDKNVRNRKRSRRAKKKRKRLYTTDSDCSESNKTFKRRKKSVYRRWTKEEMEIVSRRFNNELDLNLNPGITKCKLVLEEEPLLRGRTWLQLNSCVYNLNMRRLKNKRKLVAKVQNTDRIVPFHSHLSLPSQVLAMRIPSGESMN